MMCSTNRCSRMTDADTRGDYLVQVWHPFPLLLPLAEEKQKAFSAHRRCRREELQESRPTSLQSQRWSERGTLQWLCKRVVLVCKSLRPLSNSVT